jgi:hypothetical protein
MRYEFPLHDFICPSGAYKVIYMLTDLFQHITFLKISRHITPFLPDQASRLKNGRISTLAGLHTSM